MAIEIRCGLWFVCAGLYGNGAIVGAMNIGLSIPGAGISRPFYFMIMARRRYGGNWLVWCGIGGGCNLDCNSPDPAASRG